MEGTLIIWQALCEKSARYKIKRYLCSFQMRFFVSHTETKATSFVAFRTSSGWCSKHKEFSPKIIPIILPISELPEMFFLAKKLDRSPSWKWDHTLPGPGRWEEGCCLVKCEVFDLDYMPVIMIEAASKTNKTTWNYTLFGMTTEWRKHLNVFVYCNDTFALCQWRFVLWCVPWYIYFS